METGRSQLPVELITLTGYPEQRGYLLPINFSEFTFPVRRIFTISKLKPWQRRGNHAHKECWQAIICLQGLVVAKSRPVDSEKTSVHLLAEPSQCLIVPPLNFLMLENDREGTVILVLCSHEYDQEDYIHE
jgi:dTDP-4-dehydrorhamnose 3,5-epimerase-like enzyme